MTRPELVKALREAGGNLAAAGRALGVSRERVRVLVRKWKVPHRPMSRSQSATIAINARWHGRQGEGDAA